VCCGESNAQTAHRARECTRSTSETQTRRQRRTHLAVQLVVIVLLHQLCSSCVGGAGGHKVWCCQYASTLQHVPFRADPRAVVCSERDVGHCFDGRLGCCWRRQRWRQGQVSVEIHVVVHGFADAALERRGTTSKPCVCDSHDARESQAQLRCTERVGGGD
jgi:hypothetical protein